MNVVFNEVVLVVGSVFVEGLMKEVIFLEDLVGFVWYRWDKKL